MDRGAKKAHILRAAEESIAYQIKNVVDCMQLDSGLSLSEFRVDGKPTGDELLMQFQADVIDIAIVTPQPLRSYL